jgi:hypothetical protein
MKKLLFVSMLLAFALVFPLPTTAGVDVGVSISLPPLIVFASPPEMVVIPETYVYVVPDSDVDIFFYDGWWWRPWEGRWYRSRNYGSGWVYYRRVPNFYSGIPSGWRNDYREHRWGGQPWNYQRIPQQQVQRNWSTWKKDKHWEKQQTWGVQGLKPRKGSQQPSKAVQPKSQTKPQSRDAVKPQQSRPKSQESVEPPRSRPQSQPQSGKIQPQKSQPQQREAPQQSKPRQGKPEKGQGKPERGEEEKRDGK